MKKLKLSFLSQAFYGSIALLCVLLGLLGVVTPVLPTTPFILLALWCLSKSSPQLSKRIKNVSWWKSDISRWEENRTISIRTKFMASSIMAISLVVLWISAFLLIPKLLVTAILLGSFIFVWKH